MWVLSWKKYALSKLATFVSVIGALTRYAGVMCLVSSLIPAGLICIAVGIGIHFGAEAINKSKAKKLAGKTNAEKQVASNTAATNTTTAQPTPNPVHTNPNPVYTDPNPIYIDPDFVQQNRKTKPVNDVTQTNNLRRPCRNCGNFVLPTSNFCDKCGNKMSAEKKCLRCGYVMAENDTFCSKCGYRSN